MTDLNHAHRTGTNRLTPLRPTVSEADAEKAAESARDSYTGKRGGYFPWDAVDDSVRDEWRNIARAAFEAAGIEVQS